MDSLRTTWLHDEEGETNVVDTPTAHPPASKEQIPHKDGEGWLTKAVVLSVAAVAIGIVVSLPEDWNPPQLFKPASTEHTDPCAKICEQVGYSSARFTTYAREPGHEGLEDMCENPCEWYRPSVTAPPPAQSGSCCKYCSVGKACGNTCIQRSDTCHASGGCACDS